MLGTGCEPGARGDRSCKSPSLFVFQKLLRKLVLRSTDEIALVFCRWWVRRLAAGGAADRHGRGARSGRTALHVLGAAHSPHAAAGPRCVLPQVQLHGADGQGHARAPDLSRHGVRVHHRPSTFPCLDSELTNCSQEFRGYDGGERDGCLPPERDVGRHVDGHVHRQWRADRAFAWLGKLFFPASTSPANLFTPTAFCDSTRMAARGQTTGRTKEGK